MRYYLDTEFNGFGGKLLSMGLIREDGKCFYGYQGIINVAELHPFVKRHVYPYIHQTPMIGFTQTVTNNNFSGFIANVLKHEVDHTTHISITCDWPEDIKHFNEQLMIGPGKMIQTGHIDFNLRRVDSYPNSIENCVQHNAMWDAIALRYKLTGETNYK